MTEQGKRQRIARLTAVCVAVAAIAGGVLTGAPAQAATASSGCGLGGVALGSAGLVVAPIGCTTGSTTDGPAPMQTPPTPSAPSAPTVAEPGVPPTTEPVAAPVAAAPAPEPSAPTAGGIGTRGTAAPAAAPVADLDVVRSSPAVYPVRDGFRDDVRFAVHALDADGHLVPVTGTAALTRAGRTVRTWTLTGATSVLTWDGRSHGRIRAGVYTLHVSAWSADGSRETAVSRIRVVGKQLRHRQMMVRQNVGSGSTTAALPKRVAAAFAVGPVSVQVRTDASVSGPAALTFSNDGVTRSIRLRDGVHTTKRFALFKGFEKVAIGHRWAKGAAKLRSVKAVWSYSELR
ncbi:hypothetical protein [Amnibacterium setariae]|uniref:FlgD Ig-like domain-containing protein n=1 Tax=Amnibacterium setariae TaxID=2306585 RepID=A0A3A1U1G4_9MICO|nr:hypothetical protein [Amnibacterium setariae]RIX30203.1 hypothetical protein D1781_01775 [Amnibacterium setariae]